MRLGSRIHHWGGYCDEYASKDCKNDDKEQGPSIDRLIDGSREQYQVETSPSIVCCRSIGFGRI